MSCLWMVSNRWEERVFGWSESGPKGTERSEDINITAVEPDLELPGTGARTQRWGRPD